MSAELLARDIAWHKHAACRPGPGRDLSSMFMPAERTGRGNTLSRHERDLIDQALDLCRLCPVRPLCAADADSHHASFGVWGGQMRGTSIDGHVRVPKQWKPLARSR